MTGASETFLAEAPVARRSLLEAVDRTIAAAAPGLETWIWRGKMWGGTEQTILGYGRFRYTNRSGEEVEWFLIGLANQKAYVSLYVNAGRDGEYLGRLYAGRLGKVKVGAASVSFTRLENLDLTVLAEMAAEAERLGVMQVPEG